MSTAATSAACALADQNRWGLLGKASILSVTSYPHRTSPTIRGKWLLENILAAPVPPPPPDVNTTLDEGKTVKTTSVREMLEQHRANPACASCHANMDPLGFSLENFDSIGQWRTTDGESPIDASGVLLDGTKVDGPAALRGALLQQKDQFVKAVTGKLLLYALGRELDYHDAPAIRAIVRAAAADDHRWSSTILAIVKSTPFQMRRTKQIDDQPKPSREVAKAQRRSKMRTTHDRHKKAISRRTVLRGIGAAVSLAAARRDDSGADGIAEHAGESRAPPGGRLSPQRRGVRELAADRRRRRFRVLARARAARAVPRSRRSSSRGSPIARRKRSATAAAITHAPPART